MTLSMTGFGKSEFTIKNFHVNIEIRSLNSKFLDLSVKLPNIFKELDYPIRKLLKEKLKRGKVELIIHYEKIYLNHKTILNKDKIIAYHNDLKEISEKLSYTTDKDLIGYALQLPDIILHSKETLDEKSSSRVINSIEKACNKLIDFRTKEGLALEKELVQYLNNISKNLIAITAYEEDRLTKVKDKLLKAIDESKLKS